MPVPSDITALSTTAASNSPPGSETPSSIDDYLRSHASFIAQLRAVIGGTSTAYTLTPATALTSYAAGKTFWVTFHTASGASPTLQISGVATPPNLVRQNLSGAFVNISAGEIPTNHRSKVTMLSASQALVEDMPPYFDFLNTTRIDVASASTVNLTSNAPNTRHVNITGTTTITGFTVAAGQCYFVRFNAALTLTNNANIVTQSGSDITTLAGDTCIIRATAANTVEVLSYCQVQRLTLGSVITTNSGTSHDFTGIPAWAKRITVMLNGVSTNGASRVIVQLGASGSIEATGYAGSSSAISSAAASSAMSTGFLTYLGATGSASDVVQGQIVITNQTGNVWVASGVLGLSNTALTNTLSGAKTLAAVIDRVRLTTVNGTDTFDAGTFNIMYEG